MAFTRRNAPDDEDATARTRIGLDRTARTRLAGGRPAGGAAPPRGEGSTGALMLGRYRLIAPLGRGAFGSVWQAHDERLLRDVALKILPAAVDDDRFAREARAAARLSHPGIVTLYEAAVDDRAAYLVSELVEGATLAALIRDRLLSDGDVARIGVALSDALAHAHSQRVLHRDIKPANILVPERPQSAAAVAKLTDFGVARLFEGEPLTRTGDVIGTAAYMSPEQGAGLAMGPPSDLFSLALVLREALTGVNPLQRVEPSQRARGAQRLEPLGRERRELPRELTAVIDASLEPEPRYRPPLGDLRAAFAASAPELSDELPDGPPVRVEDRRRREERPVRGRERVGVAPDWGRDGDRATRQAESDQREREWQGAEPEREPTLARAKRVFRPSRIACALVQAAALAWIWSHVATPAKVPAAAAAALGGGVFLLLPRIGWLLAGVATAAAAAAGTHPGDAVWIGLLVAAPPLLIPLRAKLWPLVLLPAAPVIVGWGALAGAWPGLAGRTRGPFGRAGLGACGWLTVLAITVRHGSHRGYLPIPKGVLAPGVWAHTLHATLHGMLLPLVRSGALLATPVWAVSALVLPYVVRGKSLILDVVAAAAWTAATLAATGAVIAVRGQFGQFAASNGAVLGAVVAALIAVAPTLVRAWRLQAASP